MGRRETKEDGYLVKLSTSDLSIFISEPVSP